MIENGVACPGRSDGDAGGAGREGAALSLSQRSQCALLALVHLARQAPGTGAVAADVAGEQGLSPGLLEDVLATLARSRHLRPPAAPDGPWRLARPASRITLAEVIRLFDGALAPAEALGAFSYEQTPLGREARILGALDRAHEAVSEVLERTSVADLR